MASKAHAMTLSPGLASAQKVPHPKLDLFIKKQFLSADVCQQVIERIDRDRRPSTVNDDLGDTAFRTSETCDLPFADLLAKMLNAQISDFLGIHSSLGEPLQGQRYAVGQEFKAHTDYFEPGGQDFKTYCGQTGQRTWTAMIYLNEPEAGGATRFKRIKKSIQPETGKLLCWSNLDRAGKENIWTMHHGMKVRKGTKYVITKWYRQRPWPR